MIIPNYPRTVHEAAKLLDEQHPGWHERIDVDMLNMSDCKRCVLGQIYGTFEKGFKTVFGQQQYKDWIDAILPDGPFGDNNGQFCDLVLRWDAEIKKRLNKGIAQ